MRTGWNYPPCNWTGQYLTPHEPGKALQLNLHAPEGSRDISQWVNQLWGHLLEHMLGPLPEAIQVRLCSGYLGH